jgi:hypothetical protein
VVSAIHQVWLRTGFRLKTPLPRRPRAPCGYARRVAPTRIAPIFGVRDVPVDTPWGQHEGVLIDIDGNIIRFGSPMT